MLPVHLHRQISDDQECAYANESCQADGEQKPKKFNLFGAEVKAAHCLSARQLRLRPAIQRDIAMERRRPSRGFGPALDLFVARLGRMPEG